MSRLPDSSTLFVTTRSVSRVLRGIILDIATVSFRSLFLIALIAAMFPVRGYASYQISDWFKSERVPQTVWEMRDQYARLIKQSPLHYKPAFRSDHPDGTTSERFLSIPECLAPRYFSGYFMGNSSQGHDPSGHARYGSNHGV